MSLLAHKKAPPGGGRPGEAFSVQSLSRMKNAPAPRQFVQAN